MAAQTATPMAYYTAMARANLWVTSLWCEPVKWRLEVVLERMLRHPFVSDPADHEALIGLLRARVGARVPSPAVPKTKTPNQLSLF